MNALSVISISPRNAFSRPLPRAQLSVILIGSRSNPLPLRKLIASWPITNAPRPSMPVRSLYSHLQRRTLESLILLVLTHSLSETSTGTHQVLHYLTQGRGHDLYKWSIGL